MSEPNKSSRIERFRKLSPEQRLAKLTKIIGSQSNDLAGNTLPLSLADGMIENVIGVLSCRLGSQPISL